MVYRPLRYEQMMRAAEAHDVRARRMFGGMGIYAGNKMFAFLMDEDVGLKLSPEDLETALGMPGAEILIPEPDGEPMREYVKMPQSLLDDEAGFQDWLERSVRYAQGGTPASEQTVAP